MTMISDGMKVAAWGDAGKAVSKISLLTRPAIQSQVFTKIYNITKYYDIYIYNI